MPKKLFFNTNNFNPLSIWSIFQNCWMKKPHSTKVNKKAVMSKHVMFKHLQRLIVTHPTDKFSTFRRLERSFTLKGIFEPFQVKSQ